MSKKTDAFISAIAPVAQAEYTNRKRWVLPSVCIAQAALESGWNIKAKTLFGIKGTGVDLSTQEYINGKYVNVTASFKKYPDMVSAVNGYYNLITSSLRYVSAVNNPSYTSTIRAIVNGGYATDPNYYNKVVSIIQTYNLTQYDKKLTDSKKYKKTTKSIANKVIKGDYGNGEDRKQKLTADGYNYDEVQKLVNKILKG